MVAEGVSNSILKVREHVTASPSIIITQHKLSAKVLSLISISDQDLLTQKLSASLSLNSWEKEKALNKSMSLLGFFGMLKCVNDSI